MTLLLLQGRLLLSATPGEEGEVHVLLLFHR
jgi:hypothetical protein